MARLNDDAQWIVLMGFLVSFSFFFLALVINQSTVVGQTTAESVIEFPKNDIRDARSVAIDSVDFIDEASKLTNLRTDIRTIGLSRKSAVINYARPGIDGEIFYKCVELEPYYNCTRIIYNNGVTEFHEDWISP